MKRDRQKYPKTVRTIDFHLHQQQLLSSETLLH